MKMEKVKLTQEQAWMIENHGGAIERLMRKHHMKNCPTYIDELTTLQVVDAYFGGYEVEETFKVGDWVVRTKELGHQNFYEGKIFKIKRIDKGYLTGDLLVVDNDDNSEHLFENIRHATSEEIAEEKQRRWWAKHGRKPLELKINDVLLRNDGAYVSVFHVDESQEQYELIFRGEYQSGYEVDKEKINAFYKVICFVEDRKDVDHAE